VKVPDPRSAVVAGFRAMLSGQADGEPDWLRATRQRSDPGYFGPGSAVWAIHGDLSTLVGGIRALLMQCLHPGALTGVDQHSTYRQDPLGRLAGTTRWVTVTTFADRAGADREAARVRGMHRRVRGDYPDAEGRAVPYRADDQDLLAWVHAAFTDSFLSAHQAFGSAPVPGGPDAYVRQWARSAELIGLASPPRSVADLERFIAAAPLARTPATARTVQFLRRPPLPQPAAVGYQVLFAGAVSTLRPAHRELLGLPDLGTRVPRAAAATLLGGLRLVLGDGPPAAA
jgi:uncharacterized protein (DUF2236 family)